jgi:hypothetical protein
MKTVKYFIFSALLLFSVSCDNDFPEINTNPYAVTKIDPALVLAGAQRTHLGTWQAEHTIVQHFVNAYNTGATLGFNFNEDVDDMSRPKWDQSYTGPVRNLQQALTILGEDTELVNLRNIIRIWKVQVFMGLVDSYGDIPYFEAGRAVSDALFFPTYDDDAAIYDALYTELKDAVATLDPGGDFVSADLFYGTKGKNATANATDQVARWKKLGNSLLLRLGMRYSKVNPSKAQSIAAEAFAGGVMASNADNAYVKYDGTLFTQDENNNLRNFSNFYYAAQPFVDQLKSTSDPRAKFVIATFADPGAVNNDPNPDVTLANQFGVPIGVTNIELGKAPYRGPRGTGLNYSQMNIWTIASPAAPDFWVTYAQTLLLLAEAAHRGWITGSAQTYYENAIRADMQVYALYPGTTPIPDSEVDAYLAQPNVAFSAARALELINTQYWVINIRNGTEAFANFRRSGFPALSPNLYNTKLQGGFARRLSYPNHESSSNAPSYQAAVTAIGGDVLTARVFWDAP